MLRHSASAILNFAYIRPYAAKSLNKSGDAEVALKSCGDTYNRAKKGYIKVSSPHFDDTNHIYILYIILPSLMKSQSPQNARLSSIPSPYPLPPRPPLQSTNIPSPNNPRPLLDPIHKALVFRSRSQGTLPARQYPPSSEIWACRPRGTGSL